MAWIGNRKATDGEGFGSAHDDRIMKRVVKVQKLIAGTSKTVEFCKRRSSNFADTMKMGR